MTRDEAIALALATHEDIWGGEPEVADGLIDGGFACLDGVCDVEAAVALYALVSALSERCYCATWLIGAGEACHAIAAEGGGPWGMDEITAAEAEAIRALEHAAGGWWVDEPTSDGVGWSTRRNLKEATG